MTLHQIQKIPIGQMEMRQNRSPRVAKYHFGFFEPRVNVPLVQIAIIFFSIS
jgi:hypothetical protein